MSGPSAFVSGLALLLFHFHGTAARDDIHLLGVRRSTAGEVELAKRMSIRAVIRQVRLSIGAVRPNEVGNSRQAESRRFRSERGLDAKVLEGDGEFHVGFAADEIDGGLCEGLVLGRFDEVDVLSEDAVEFGFGRLRLADDDVTSNHLAFQTDPESNPRHALARQGDGDLTSRTGVVRIHVGRSQFVPPVRDVDFVSPRESVGEGFFAEIDGAVGVG
mmetsp:Transcript_17516/g.36760  ORF Transcript_17516/g.36760 Transcript_17516/m.36760 type:complete len:217 (-) Transcript_17516:139-789(-)